MIKVIHSRFGHVRLCPSQVCADKLLNGKKHPDGTPVWVLANQPVFVPEAKKRKYGEPVKKETLKEIKQKKETLKEVEEADELSELQERYEAQKGKKPHWKKNAETLKKELGDV